MLPELLVLQYEWQLAQYLLLLALYKPPKLQQAACSSSTTARLLMQQCQLGEKAAGQVVVQPLQQLQT